MQTIVVSDKLLIKLKELCQEGGYDSVDAWLEEAVEHQMATLRRQKAEEIARRIRQGLQSQGHTEEEILSDFEAFRRQRECEADQV